jgi:hypothetical protein
MSSDLVWESGVLKKRKIRATESIQLGNNVFIPDPSSDSQQKYFMAKIPDTSSLTTLKLLISSNGSLAESNVSIGTSGFTRSGSNTFTSSTGNNTLSATSGSNLLNALNNTVTAISGGQNTLNAANGKNLLTSAINELISNVGDNKLNATNGGGNLLTATDGVNALSGGNNTVTAVASGGNNTLTASTGKNVLNGGSNDITATGSGGNNTLTASTGTNILSGSYNSISATGSGGNNTLASSSGTNYVTAYYNEMTASTGNNTLTASSGTNIVNAYHNSISATGSGGNNTLTASTGTNTSSGVNNALTASVANILTAPDTNIVGRLNIGGYIVTPEKWHTLYLQQSQQFALQNANGNTEVGIGMVNPGTTNVVKKIGWVLYVNSVTWGAGDTIELSIEDPSALLINKVTLTYPDTINAGAYNEFLSADDPYFYPTQISYALCKVKFTSSTPANGITFYPKLVYFRRFN